MSTTDVGPLQSAAEDLVRHLARRLVEDADLFYLCGPGTESCRLLCCAVAEVEGRPVAEIEDEVRRIRHPKRARTLYRVDEDAAQPRTRASER